MPPPAPSTLDPITVDLEASVCGAILFAAALDLEAGHRVVDRVVATGLLPGHFWRQSLGRLYGVLVAERDLGHPVDALSISYVLERGHADPHMRGRLEELAHTCPAFTLAEHWARLICREARHRTVAR